MRTSTIRKVEDILRDYPKIDGYIERREEELRYPTAPQDENVGGGKAKNVRTENEFKTLVTIDEDRRLNALKRQRDIVSDALDGAGVDTETIIRELYFKKRPAYTLPGLIENNKLHCGRHKAYELRNNFVKEVAKELGLFDV